MKKQKSYSFEEELHTRIRVMAAKMNLNLNDFIDLAIDALEKERGLK